MCVRERSGRACHIKGHINSFLKNLLKFLREFFFRGNLRPGLGGGRFFEKSQHLSIYNEPAQSIAEIGHIGGHWRPELELG